MRHALRFQLIHLPAPFTIKHFDILPSWQYGAILTDDESGLCLDPTPCNIYYI